jgi:sulfur relay (sulfurtransferase) DsrF/TusC family protein
MQSSVLLGEDMEKKVVFLISSPPFETLNNYEALRTSLALFNHQVTIIWKGNGVNYPLKTIHKIMTKNYLTLAKDMGITLFVVRKDLKDRELEDIEIEQEVELISNTELLDIIGAGDIVINF